MATNSCSKPFHCFLSADAGSGFSFFFCRKPKSVLRLIKSKLFPVALLPPAVASSQCCERLQKEKQEARVGFEEALTRLREQHREELAQLEER